VDEPTQHSGRAMNRARRIELLAIAERDAIVSLADACIADTGSPEIIQQPETGTVMLTVREPVERLRFHLGEVLVSRAEVRHRDEVGWATVVGSDLARALAAAVLDAEAAAGGPWTDAIDACCEEVERRRRDQLAEEWRRLAPTIVSFEELQ
jgi:alpha-D-ribose 1-methylphosphonate 5-triphosphate synthase subunit PhnG